MHIWERFLQCLVLFPKGMDLADLYGTDFSMAKGKALTTSFLSALVLEQIVNDKFIQEKSVRRVIKKLTDKTK